MTPIRLHRQNGKFFITPLSCDSQKRPEHKENQTKYRYIMTRKPWSHVRIFIIEPGLYIFRQTKQRKTQTLFM